MYGYYAGDNERNDYDTIEKMENGYNQCKFRNAR